MKTSYLTNKREYTILCMVVVDRKKRDALWLLLENSQSGRTKKSP